MNAEISKSQVSDLVKSVFQRVLSGKEVDDSFNLNDEGIDSLTRVELVMELESAIASDLSIQASVPDDLTANISTVGALSEELYHRLNEQLLKKAEAEGK